VTRYPFSDCELAEHASRRRDTHVTTILCSRSACPLLVPHVEHALVAACARAAIEQAAT
jgi:hypothetical protein